MAVLQQEMAPRRWAEIAKDFVIMIAVSAVIIAGVVLLKQIIPPLG